MVAIRQEAFGSVDSNRCRGTHGPGQILWIQPDVVLHGARLGKTKTHMLLGLNRHQVHHLSELFETLLTHHVVLPFRAENTELYRAGEQIMPLDFIPCPDMHHPGGDLLLNANFMHSCGPLGHLSHSTPDHSRDKQAHQDETDDGV